MSELLGSECRWARKLAFLWIIKKEPKIFID
jgi:hypothetical protein